MLPMLDIVLLSVAALGFLLPTLGFMTIFFDSCRADRRIDAIYNSHIEAH